MGIWFSRESRASLLIPLLCGPLVIYLRSIDRLPRMRQFHLGFSRRSGTLRRGPFRYDL
jgi:hypothetical protein